MGVWRVVTSSSLKQCNTTVPSRRIFEIGEGGDGGNTGGGGDTSVTDPEPPKRPEEMLGALLGTVVESNFLKKPDGTGMSPPDAATRDADVATDCRAEPASHPGGNPGLFWLHGAPNVARRLFSIAESCEVNDVPVESGVNGPSESASDIKLFAVAWLPIRWGPLFSPNNAC